MIQQLLLAALACVSVAGAAETVTSPDGKVVATETATGDTIWKPVWGFLSEVRDHYHELTVKLQETIVTKRQFHVVVEGHEAMSTGHERHDEKRIVTRDGSSVPITQITIVRRSASSG
jgi:hypothetical protein